jgi:hypothetical protein
MPEVAASLEDALLFPYLLKFNTPLYPVMFRCLDSISGKYQGDYHFGRLTEELFLTLFLGVACGFSGSKGLLRNGFGGIKDSGLVSLRGLGVKTLGETRRSGCSSLSEALVCGDGVLDRERASVARVKVAEVRMGSKTELVIGGGIAPVAVAGREAIGMIGWLSVVRPVTSRNSR